MTDHPSAERSSEGLLDTAVAVITQPAATMDRLGRHPRTAWAVILTVVLSLLSALAFSAGMASGPPGFQPGGMPIPPSQLRTVLIVFSVIFAPIAGLIGLAIGTGVLHLAGLLLKGQGSYPGLFSALAFANVPSVFGIPAQLFPLAVGVEAGAVLAFLVSLGISIWVVVLAVIAVRESHRFSTGRAVAAVLIPVAVLIALFVLVIILVAVLVAGSLSQMPGG